MTDHSKARAGKAPNKNHKVVHADVKVAAKDLHKVAEVKAQKVAADAKTATATMFKNISTSLHQLKDAGVKAKKVAAAHKVSATVKTGTHKAGSGLKGTKSNALNRTPISILFPLARLPATMSRRIRVRFSKLPPNLPSRVCAPRNSCSR